MAGIAKRVGEFGAESIHTIPEAGPRGLVTYSRQEKELRKDIFVA